MDQEKSELLVVRLPLTEEDRRTAAVAEQDVPADIGLVFAAVARALGTPVPDSGLEVAAHERMSLNYGWQPCNADVGFYRSRGQQIRELVCKHDADAQIATRDAEIVELRTRLETVERETREACAMICDRLRREEDEIYGIGLRADQSRVAMRVMKECATAIRSAGEKA